jgi:hypothetical protein
MANRGVVDAIEILQLQSASLTGSASLTSRASSKSGEMLAFPYTPQAQPTTSSVLSMVRSGCNARMTLGLRAGA